MADDRLPCWRSVSISATRSDNVLSAADGDLLEPPPEGVFKADAGLMTGDNDRALDDWRLHCLSPFLTRTGPLASDHPVQRSWDVMRSTDLAYSITRPASQWPSRQLSGGKAAAFQGQFLPRHLTVALSSAPLASFDRWRGKSTAEPSHRRTSGWTNLTET